MWVKTISVNQLLTTLKAAYEYFISFFDLIVVKRTSLKEDNWLDFSSTYMYIRFFLDRMIFCDTHV